MSSKRRSHHTPITKETRHSATTPPYTPHHNEPLSKAHHQANAISEQRSRPRSRRSDSGYGSPLPFSRQPSRCRLHGENCAPRMKNLQTGMDQLRSEIQRLKSVDIHSYSRQTTDRRPPSRTHDTSSSRLGKSATRRRSREEMNARLVKLGLLHPDQESDGSDTSEMADIDTFIKELRSERDRGLKSVRATDEERPASRSLRTTSSRGSRSSIDDQEKPKQRSLASKATDVEAHSCTECTAARNERFQLIGQIRNLEASLQKQTECAHEAQVVVENCHIEIQQLQNEKAALKSSETEAVSGDCHASLSLEEQDSKCKLLEIQIRKLKDEIRGYRRQWMDLEDSYHSLQEENTILRESFASWKEPTEDSTRSGHLMHLLEDCGVRQEYITSVIATIDRLYDNSCGEMEATLHRSNEGGGGKDTGSKDAEIDFLTEEKSVLSQKVQELLRMVRKETFHKETAQSEIAKLKHVVQERHSELEQCRTTLQQKRQQVSELEDSLAIVQHENENWERDYKVLEKRKEHIERELRIAKNLEKAFEQTD